jgi:hypothetical protein
MVAVNRITTYRENDMLWAEATEVVDVSADAAWESLDTLLMNLIEIPAVGGESVEVSRVKEGVPVTHAGNRIIAKATMLGGIIQAKMSMTVKVSEAPRYLRLAINVFTNHFADVEFRIVPEASGCRLSFRQGFRSRKRVSGSIGEHAAAKSTEMPETARIFNMWVEVARAA